ncbi:MAG: ATP-binding protein [Lentisphaeria bacterium]|nr:ATP-binding protein [Lentisphaeria bacterium]
MDKKSLQNLLHQTEASFNLLFEQVDPREGMRKIISNSHRDFLELLLMFLKRLHTELDSDVLPDSDTFRPDQADTTDLLNALAGVCGNKNFGTLLDETLFEALLRLNKDTPLRPELLKAVESASTLTGGTLRHAVRFAENMDQILKNTPALLRYRNNRQEEILSRLTPAAGGLAMRYSMFLKTTLKGLAIELALQFEKNDLFNSSRTFRYMDQKFVPVILNSIRQADEFFGYNEAKRVFKEHFTSFAEGKHNLPLLINGLPGLGKTQMTIAYALEIPELTVILPGPESLQEGLEELIRHLAAARHHRFVVFFDDIDTRNINWYYFRTHVGGSFSLPENVTVVIASNYRFPPNISSRGRAFEFPLFDEIRCQEMIEDLFLSKGMEHVAPELLSVIAADYVESFGQKLFDELSPRTLARYLELYLADQEKRKQMLEFSRGEIITRPDPQAFYEQNIKLLRALYGKEAIDEIRKQELSL